MFGTYRTLLALAVIVHHLLSFPVIGQYAVHGFFILSGFLMTTIMAGSYGYSLKGFRAFALNRFLRLYPAYWFIWILSLVLVLVYGESVFRSYHSAIYLPNTPGEWIQNLTLIYFDAFPMQVTPRLAPPTWALTVELLFYALIALGLSRTRGLTLVWFACSVVYTAVTHVLELGHPYRYMFIAAGSLPFSMGALLYHYQEWIKARVLKISTFWSFLAMLIIFTVNSLVAGLSKYFSVPHADLIGSVALYLNLGLNFLIIATLLNKPKFPYGPKVDKFIGDFSYPIYLCHWQAGFLASMIIWGSPERGPSHQGITVFALALVICAVLSLITMRFIDRPIEELRSRIRRRAKSVVQKARMGTT